MGAQGRRRLSGVGRGASVSLTADDGIDGAGHRSTYAAQPSPPPRWGFPLLTRTATAPHDGTFPSYDDSNVPGVLRHCRRFSGDSERPFGGRLLSVRLRPCLDRRQGQSVCGNSCDAAADATPAPIENSVRIEGLDLLPRRIVDRSPRNVAARGRPPIRAHRGGEPTMDVCLAGSLRRAPSFGRFTPMLRPGRRERS